MKFDAAHPMSQWPHWLQNPNTMRSAPTRPTVMLQGQLSPQTPSTFICRAAAGQHVQFQVIPSQEAPNPPRS